MNGISTVFSSQARKSDSFFYRKGNVVTRQIWYRPSYQRLVSFLRDVSTCTDILDRYSVFLIGGCLYSWDLTWDVDIHLVSKDFDVKTLESDFDFLNNLSLNKYNQLLDVTWTDTVHPDFVVYTGNNLNDFISECRVVKSRFVEKMINNDHKLIDLGETTGCDILSESLVQASGSIPGEKTISRMILNKGKKLVLSMEVKRILLNNEDFFIENSNHNKVR